MVPRPGIHLNRLTTRSASTTSQASAEMRKLSGIGPAASHAERRTAREEVIGKGQRPPERAKRGAMSVAGFKVIGELVWDRVGGASGGVWDNQA